MHPYRTVPFALISLFAVSAASGLALGCSADAGDASGSSGGVAASGGVAMTSGGATAGGGVGSGGGGAASGGAASGGGSASGGAAASLCERAGVLFCDDFESHTAGAFPGAPWVSTAVGSDGVISVDATTPAKSGTKSVKVDSLGNYQTFLTLTGAPVFSAPRGSLYVRTQLRLGAPMTGGHNTYFKAGAAGASSSNNETRVGVMLEMLMINQPDGDRGVLSNQNYWNDKLPGVVIAKETWTCVEAFFDPEHTTVSVAVDGVDVPDLHLTDWKQDPLGALHFGFEQYAGPAAVIWYDDIAVGTEPIGCD